MKDQPLGLYVHIPFCSSKCDYCDFVSYSMDRKAQQEYLAGLFEEIDRRKMDYDGRTFDSIFIGGGTPSIVYEGFIVSLARKLFSSFKFKPDTEFTIEVNPASFTKEKFMEYVQAGVNRISIGVQCLDGKLLANHGRVQSLENIKETFRILENAEFPNVSCDVMIGLPKQSAGQVKNTVKFLVKHKVKHISAYTLQVEKHTLLYDKIRKGHLKPVKDEKIVKTYKKIAKYLKKKGYVRYEISNFAKPEFECRHNIKYWTDTEYLGLGVSAHSYVNYYRYYNTKRLDTYIDHLKNGESPVYAKEYVTDATRRTERIMLSLRMTKGLDLTEFQEEFKEDLLKSKAKQINSLIELGMLEVVDNHLRITENNFNVANSIIVELLD